MKKFAFVFPGQGSQSLGMLQELSATYSIVKKTFQEASIVLNYDLWDIVQNGPQAKLDQTEITQPAMLCADIAIFRIWQTLTDLKPSLLAGHSLGEYAALVASEALVFSDAVSLVAKRGEYMQNAVPAGAGAMAAIIGLSDKIVKSICLDSQSGEIVSPANFNAIGQIVIAGHKGAVLRAVEKSKKAGAKLAKLIPVSVPSHSPLMSSAAMQLEKALNSVRIHAPLIPVIHNFDVASYSCAQDITPVLVKQLTEPVRWVETIQAMHAENIEACVECGPGKVLTGLIKRIDRTIAALPTEDVDALNSAIEAVS